MEFVLRDLPRFGKFLITLALEPNQNRFKQALHELGVTPTEKTETKLSRNNGVVTWMWGDNPKIELIKDEFLPSRYVMDEGGSNAQEVTINEYTGASSTAFRIPKLIWIKLQGKELFRYDMKSTKINQKLKWSNDKALTSVKSQSAKDWTSLVR
jgi:hypothetical protein